MLSFINDQKIMVTESMVTELLLRLLPENTNGGGGATYKEMLPEYLDSLGFRSALSIDEVTGESCDFMDPNIWVVSVGDLFKELNHCVSVHLETHTVKAMEDSEYD